ncbi:hypothetical protein CCHR01_16787 [Colletotrichum chrysophilum]|uniref:Uncharacterized protein n=1 Tax=Colletotrichum chrysophilum TaxID=1836956 RepID=A0AAD9EAI6_9PEZI|nr:hypothetical protein CCHR01_16787 [Colletotrichum chrysophilum]
MGPVNQSERFNIPTMYSMKQTRRSSAMDRYGVQVNPLHGGEPSATFTANLASRARIAKARGRMHSMALQKPNDKNTAPVGVEDMGQAIFLGGW